MDNTKIPIDDLIKALKIHRKTYGNIDVTLGLNDEGGDFTITPTDTYGLGVADVIILQKVREY